MNAILLIRAYDRLLRIGSVVLGTLHARWWFWLQGCSVGPGLRVDGCLIVRCSRPGAIRIGRGCQFKSRRGSNLVGGTGPCILQAVGSGTIEIGDHSGMSFSVVSSRCRVQIGRHVMIGGNARIYDHDFHSKDPFHRRSGALDQAHIRSAPIVIEDDVLIGANAIVLKGVTIGTGAVIGAGAVVTKNVPPREIWAGNPARMVGRVTET